MNNYTPIVCILFLFNSIHVIAQDSPFISTSNFDASIDSLWQEEIFFFDPPKVDLEDKQVWYDEMYSPVYNSWKYFEILGNTSKGSYVGIFNFIQIENYQYKVNPSHFEFEAGKADENLIYKEEIKDQILDWKFLPNHLTTDHPNLAERNVITSNSNYKGLKGLGSTTISGAFLLDSRSMIGGRAGYKWIFGKKWMIEPSINYIISWDARTFYILNEDPFISINDGRLDFKIIERNPDLTVLGNVLSFLARNALVNVRFGYCLF